MITHSLSLVSKLLFHGTRRVPGPVTTQLHSPEFWLSKFPLSRKVLNPDHRPLALTQHSWIRKLPIITDLGPVISKVTSQNENEVLIYPVPRP